MIWIAASRRLCALLLAMLLFFAGVPLQADSWAPPVTQTVASESGNWRFTVEPSPLESALQYFREEIQSAEEGGTVERPAPLGMLEHRMPSGDWSPVWSGPLVNAIAPVSLLVAEDGHVVTFDNWHNVGYGKDVVVIYDPAGHLVREMALTDFVPQDYIDSLPHSVSSLSWRKSAQISSDTSNLLLELRIPGRDEKSHHGLGFSVNLADGQIQAPSSEDMASAIAQSERVHASIEAKEHARLAYLTSPLAAPAGCEPADWHGYLREAHMRLTPYWLDMPVADTNVLLPPGHARSKDSVKWLREAVEAEVKFPGEVAIASPCHEARLVTAMRKAFVKIAPGTLSETIFYISASAETRRAVDPIIAPSGAAVRWLDPTYMIEQRPERIPGSPEEAAANEERQRLQMELIRGDLIEGF